MRKKTRRTSSDYFSQC